MQEQATNLTESQNISLTGLVNTVTDFGVEYLVRPDGSYLTDKDGNEIKDPEIIKNYLTYAMQAPVEEITEEVKEAGNANGDTRYFKTPIHSDYKGYMAAVSGKQAHDMGISDIYVGMSHKGHPEFRSKSVEPVESQYITYGIGTHNDKTYLFFWNPGDVLAPTNIVKLARS